MTEERDRYPEHLLDQVVWREPEFFCKVCDFEHSVIGPCPSERIPLRSTTLSQELGTWLSSDSSMMDMLDTQSLDSNVLALERSISKAQLPSLPPIASRRVKLFSQEEPTSSRHEIEQPRLRTAKRKGTSRSSVPLPKHARVIDLTSSQQSTLSEATDWKPASLSTVQSMSSTQEDSQLSFTMRLEPTTSPHPALFGYMDQQVQVKRVQFYHENDQKTYGWLVRAFNGAMDTIVTQQSSSMTFVALSVLFTGSSDFWTGTLSELQSKAASSNGYHSAYISLARIILKMSTKPSKTRGNCYDV